jgi:hypothetical protein
VDTAWEQRKLEATRSEMLLNRAESHTSGAWLGLLRLSVQHAFSFTEIASADIHNSSIRLW